ncbi:cytochrome P450 family protein [Micromonosporaceae bacterium Da 78-11]
MIDLLLDPAGPHLRDPHPVLRRLRDEAPVHRRAGRAGEPTWWYLTRYPDVQQALHHPDLGRQVDRLPAELAAPHRRAQRLDPLAVVRRNVFHLDPPDHTRLRRLMAPAFGARTVAAIDRHIRQVVDGLVDDLAAVDGAADVITSVALPLPVLVMAELIGFPIDDLDRLRGWSDEICRSRDAGRVHRAGLEFVAYLDEKIEQRRACPGEDLLSQLVRSAQAEMMTGTPTSRAELISSVFQLLLAGDETTVNLIGNAVLELLRHPAQLARLRARPDLIDSAVEEVMRFNGPVGHARHLYALADVEIGGVPIPRGDVVVPVLMAANRDPDVFPDPDVFDITRTPNRHLGFGHGMHFCLGAALARLQARAAVGTLVRRFPELALAVDPDELRWTPELFLHGLVRLPVLVRGVV